MYDIISELNKIKTEENKETIENAISTIEGAMQNQTYLSTYVYKLLVKCYLTTRGTQCSTCEFCYMCSKLSGRI